MSGKHQTRRQARITVGVAVVCGLLLMACGSSTTTSGNASGNSAAKAAALAAVQAAASPVKFIDPGGPVNISASKGKKIWIVSANATIPFVIAVFAGAKAAAAKAGLSVQVFDGQGAGPTEASGIEQAIAAKAAAIVLFGINLKNVAVAVTDAKSAHIPILAMLTEDAAAPIEAGGAGEVTIDYYTSGQLLSAYAVANTDGPVQAVLQNLPSIDTFAALRKGVEDGLTKYCPSGCKLSVDDLQQSDLTSGTEALTTTEIARNPGLNWIFPCIDGFAGSTVTGVETAGKQSNIRVGSINAVSVDLGYIATGRVQAVDIGNSNAWLGWAAVDRALRAAAGQPAAVSVVPIKLFYKGNLGGLDISNEDSVFDNVDFRAGYASLWQG